jgi:hypothetical protein
MDSSNNTDMDSSNNTDMDSSNNTNMDMDMSKFYKLFIYIDSESTELKQLYIDAVSAHNIEVDNYLNCLINNNPDEMEVYCCFTPLFHLFCPYDIDCVGTRKIVIDHKVVLSMKMKHCYVSYFLHACSNQSVTPLRLANSGCIIDSGYRGNIVSVFDHDIHAYDFMKHKILFGARLLQICPPNIEYPMKIYIMDDVESLGITQRS